MDPSLLAGFALVSLTLACTPGADWAYIISSAISRRSFVPAVIGLLVGYLFHTALVAAGIAALVAGSPQLLSWLTAIGALYLFWLGISTLRNWRSAAFHDGPLEEIEAEDRLEMAGASAPQPTSGTLTMIRKPKLRRATPRADFAKGVLTSATNPKALLLYVALIPQFITEAAAWPLALQTTLLGLLHFAVSIGVYFAVALGARILLRSRPLAARVVTVLSGLIMICLSIGLIFEQILLK